jgi:hypothetical protein
VRLVSGVVQSPEPAGLHLRSDLYDGFELVAQ